jgi:hypothetical protein
LRTVPGIRGQSEGGGGGKKVKKKKFEKGKKKGKKFEKRKFKKKFFPFEKFENQGGKSECVGGGSLVGVDAARAIRSRSRRRRLITRVVLCAILYLVRVVRLFKYRKQNATLARVGGCVAGVAVVAEGRCPGNFFYLRNSLDEKKRHPRRVAPISFFLKVVHKCGETFFFQIFSPLAKWKACVCDRVLFG